MKAIHRKDAPDAVWHITGRVNWQVWYLESEAAYEIFVRCLREALERFGVDLLGVVVMSNHYHMVVRCPEETLFRLLTGRRTRCRHFRPWPPAHPKSSVVSQFIRHVKLSAAKRIQEKLELTGHFWQGRHHRRRLLNDQALVIAIAYDHRNPVREGMAPRPELYERSSAAWWATGESNGIPITIRPDLPFGLTRDALRGRILRAHNEERLDDSMEAFARSRLEFDSPEGLEALRKITEELGLAPWRAA